LHSLINLDEPKSRASALIHLLQVIFIDPEGHALLEALGFTFFDSTRSTLTVITGERRREPGGGGGSGDGGGGAASNFLATPELDPSGVSAAISGSNFTTLQAGVISSFSLAPNVSFSFEVVAQVFPEKFRIQEEVTSLDLSESVALVIESVQKHNFSFVPSDDASSLGFISFRTPASMSKGYSELCLKNTNGAMRNFSQVIYYTEGCPYVGWWGEGAGCKPCPRGAICPGGYRHACTCVHAYMRTASIRVS
jgi:hypothetical protein